MIWTPEIEADLERRWTTTADSASQIAELYGTTKNDIIGKCRRLNFRRLKGQKVARPSADATLDLPSVPSVPSHDMVKTPLPQAIMTSMLPTPPGEGVHLYDLEYHHCRWPHPENKSWYCGEPKERGSYCAEHGALAYRGGHFVTGKKSPYPHQKRG